LIIALNFTLTPLCYLLTVRDAVSKASGIRGALEGSDTMRAIGLREWMHQGLTRRLRNNNLQ